MLKTKLSAYVLSLDRERTKSVGMLTKKRNFLILKNTIGLKFQLVFAEECIKCNAPNVIHPFPLVFLAKGKKIQFVPESQKDFLPTKKLSQIITV